MDWLSSAWTWVTEHWFQVAVVWLLVLTSERLGDVLVHLGAIRGLLESIQSNTDRPFSYDPDD